MAGAPWHILTGEYPPRPGGVSDYSAPGGRARPGRGRGPRLGARRRERRADARRRRRRRASPDRGVVASRPAPDWARRSTLSRLPAGCWSSTPPRWGRKGLNLGFCRWLVEQGRRDDVRLMFHEVCYPWRLRDKPTRWLLAAGQRWMARTLLKAGSTVYTSIPNGNRYSAPRVCGTSGRSSGSPSRAPSPRPRTSGRSPRSGGGWRRRGRRSSGASGPTARRSGAMLAEVLPRLLGGRDGRVGVLIGRGSETFAARLRAAHPVLAGRLIATGGLPRRGCLAAPASV